MKNLKIILFLIVFTIVGFTTAQAQRVESDSKLIGKWDLTINMDEDRVPHRKDDIDIINFNVL